MRKLFLLFTFVLSTMFCVNAQKKALDHSVYDSWKLISEAKVSNSGEYIAYVIKPQKGDAMLVIETMNGKERLEIPRAEGISFFADDKYMKCIQKPSFQDVRKAKKDKKKPAKSSTIIVDLAAMNYQLVKEEHTSLMCRTHEPLMFVLQKMKPVKPQMTKAQTAKPDSVKMSKADELIVDSLKKVAAKNMQKNVNMHKNVKGKPSVKKNDASKTVNYNRLLIVNLETKDTTTIDSINEFSINSGDKFSLLVYTRQKDSIKTVWAYNLKEHRKLYTVKGEFGQISSDKEGNQILFTSSTDTTKIKMYDVYLVNTGDVFKKNFNPDKFKARRLKINDSEFMPKGYCFNSLISFSDNGKYLRFNYAKKPVEPKKDTLLADEKFSLDIWSTSDTINMPQQLKRRSSKISSYSAQYSIKDGKLIVLGDKTVPNVSFHANADVNYGLAMNNRNYIMQNDWEYPTPNDCYLVNTKTGKRELVCKEFLGEFYFNCPDGKYIVYFDANKGTWNSYELSTKIKRIVSSDSMFVNKSDMPIVPASYGMLGWNAACDRFYVYDEFDVWELDPLNKVKAVCVTNSWGRNNNVQLRRIELEYKEKEQKAVIDFNKPNVFTTFNKSDRKAAYAEFQRTMPEPSYLIEPGDYMYKLISVSKDADKCLWLRESFTEDRNLWKSSKKFANAEKITELNPQMKDYKWGSVELMTWIDFNGDKSEGLLYKPENYDPNKKYPTIVYFYETSTEEKNAFHMPQPSWSIIIPSMFTSNDYVVFMPDITYVDGYPGECCYNKVVSGANALIERGISDPERIGLQGQSWGGYQIAYFGDKNEYVQMCKPGAPVSNMTSAMGGIRYGSGMVRMFQYEHGQSRIGQSLWEAPMRYVENSPLFYIPKVQTPLLIRHDDADDAVPFSQGVELYTALRRCGKTAWMLNYNKEPHNLRSRPARVDWTIRMHQFFDYYLKDAPMPRWMKEGISIEEKGIDQKYDY